MCQQALVTGGAGTPAVIGSASAAAGDAGVSTVSMIFAASAKSAATFALSTGIISGVSAGISEGFESHDFNKALKASTLEASEGFKWGAITGAITGGVGKYQELRFQKAMESFAKYSEMTSLNPESPIISTDIPEGYFYESTDLPTFLETPMDINTLNAEGLSPWQIAEKKAEAIFGGEAQVAFLNGERAAPNIKNVTKPDIVRKTANGYEAIEVKHYDLLNNLSQLINKLKGQIGDRVQNLPDNFEQRIVLDVTGRNYSKEFVMECIEKIQNSLVDIYPDIPINVVGI